MKRSKLNDIRINKEFKITQKTVCVFFDNFENNLSSSGEVVNKRTSE